MRARNQLNGLTHYSNAVRAVLDGLAVRRPQERIDERPYRFSDISPQVTDEVLGKLNRKPGLRSLKVS